MVVSSASAVVSLGGRGGGVGHTKRGMFRGLLEPSRDMGGSQISGCLETKVERRSQKPRVGNLPSESETPPPCAPSEENRAKRGTHLELCSGAKVEGGDSVTKAPRCFWKTYLLPALTHPQPEPGKGNIPSSRYWAIRPS